MIAEILVSFLLVVGGVFALVGSYGLAKLPDMMTRLHAPTKSTTLGVGGCLLASMAYFGLIADGFSMHELLITLFLFLTAPITANMIAKAHMHSALALKDLPPSGSKEDWATYDPVGPQGPAATRH